MPTVTHTLPNFKNKIKHAAFQLQHVSQPHNSNYFPPNPNLSAALRSKLGYLQPRHSTPKTSIIVGG